MYDVQISFPIDPYLVTLLRIEFDDSYFDDYRIAADNSVDPSITAFFDGLRAGRLHIVAGFDSPINTVLTHLSDYADPREFEVIREDVDSLGTAQERSMWSQMNPGRQKHVIEQAGQIGQEAQAALKAWSNWVRATEKLWAATDEQPGRCSSNEVWVSEHLGWHMTALLRAKFNERFVTGLAGASSPELEGPVIHTFFSGLASSRLEIRGPSSSQVVMRLLDHLCGMDDLDDEWPNGRDEGEFRTPSHDWSQIEGCIRDLIIKGAAETAFVCQDAYTNLIEEKSTIRPCLSQGE